MTYRNGRDLEHAVRHDLTNRGWWVMRAAGSKGKVDLLAIRSGEAALVQCKRNGVCPPGERAELLRIAALMYGLIPVVASKPLRQPIAYRQLTGQGPKEWINWDAGDAA